MKIKQLTVKQKLLNTATKKLVRLFRYIGEFNKINLHVGIQIELVLCGRRSGREVIQKKYVTIIISQVCIVYAQFSGKHIELIQPTKCFIC